MARIKLFASLRKAAGLKETVVVGTNVSEILSTLLQAHPALAAHLVEDGQIRPRVLITINGQVTQDLTMPVAEDDEIAIFPPIAGG